MKPWENSITNTQMKTETKHTHTQGPWKAYFYAKDSYGRIVATVGANDGCNRICEISPFDLPENEVEANARLIAAAPELLQVAKDFLLLASLHDWEGAAIDFAKATLGKAEGNA
jgi:hypothetical protein